MNVIPFLFSIEFYSCCSVITALFYFLQHEEIYQKYIFLWNCLQLLNFYRIMDRMFLHPILSGFMDSVCFCVRICIHVFCIVLFVSAVCSCLLCHITEIDSSPFVCLHSQETAVSEINTPLSAGQLTVYFQTYLSFGKKVSLSTFRSDPEYFFGWRTLASMSEKTDKSSMLSHFIGPFYLSCGPFLSAFSCPLA